MAIRKFKIPTLNSHKKNDDSVTNGGGISSGYDRLNLPEQSNYSRSKRKASFLDIFLKKGDVKILEDDTASVSLTSNTGFRYNENTVDKKDNTKNSATPSVSAMNDNDLQVQIKMIEQMSKRADEKDFVELE